MLLGVGLVATLLSCIGVLVMPNVFDRLHYTAPASTVGALGIALSIVVEEGWSAASVKALFVFVLLVSTNPVLTHATARAARIRQFGHWVALRAERVDEPEAGAVNTALQFVSLTMIAAAGLGVVLTRDPLRQAIVVSFFGMLLGILFFVLQAPDVALSEIVVGAVASPLMILLALAKVRGGAE